MSYDFTEKELKYLPGICVLGNCDDVQKILDQKFTKKELVSMFANFISLSSKVIENQKDMFELIAIAELNAMPHTVEKFNLPSLLGAFAGYDIAKNVEETGLCSDCAFKKGSIPNTCLTTVHDCIYQKENDDLFYCHKEFNDDGSPKNKCIGFMKSRKEA